MIRRSFMGKSIDTTYVGRNKEQTLLRIHLGWDACAEHEEGIKLLREKFEIRSIAARTFDARNFQISKIPYGFHMGFHVLGGQYITTLSREDTDRFLNKYGCHDNMECFWDKNHFLIVAKMVAAHERAMLNAAYGAICSLNAAFYLKSNGLGQSLTIERLAP